MFNVLQHVSWPRHPIASKYPAKQASSSRTVRYVWIGQFQTRKNYAHREETPYYRSHSQAYMASDEGPFHANRAEGSSNLRPGSLLPDLLRVCCPGFLGSTLNAGHVDHASLRVQLTDHLDFLAGELLRLGAVIQSVDCTA